MSINFVNPYNFVPLSNKSPERLNISATENKESDSQELLTGKIEYTIETLTPLFIPNTSNDKAFDVHAEKEDGEKEDDKKYHHSYDFFSYDDISNEYGKKYHEDDYHQPVIPGSEIRGAVRSIFETFTNSCLSIVDMDGKLSKRTPETFKVGVLVRENNVITLYEAIDCIYRCDETPDDKWEKKYYKNVKGDDGKNVIDGQKVYFSKISRGKAKPIAEKLSLKKGDIEGYLMKGEAGPKMKRKMAEKHNAHIFEKASKTSLSWDIKEFKDVESRLNAIIKIYQDNAGSKVYEEYENTWTKFKSQQVDSIPVYYSAIDKVCYLSPACITREVYKATMSELLGNHKPCVSKSELCPACALFGAVQSNLKVASKIRFSDAYVGEIKDNKDYYLDIVSLQELSAPKLSSTEFYLKRPEVTNVMNWTYDYYVVRRDSGDVEAKLYTPTIAGRKFYWHSNNLGDKIINDAKMKLDKKTNKVVNTERNRTIRPVKSGETFLGELYFEGITHKQLQQLVAIMNLSSYNTKDDNSVRYAMKLGGAKPLGLGSVSVKVNSVKCRELSIGQDNSFGYSEKEAINDYNQMLDVVFDGNTNILKILDLDALKPGMVLTYPKKEEGDEGFVWFVNNKIKYKLNPSGTKLIIGETTEAPSKRTQVEYAQYMKSLQVELGGKAKSVVSDKTGNKQANSKQSGQKNNNYSNAKGNVGSPTINKGDIVDVILTYIDGETAKVTLKDLPFKGRIFNLITGTKKGDIVKMKVNKINDNMYLCGDYVGK